MTFFAKAGRIEETTPQRRPAYEKESSILAACPGAVRFVRWLHPAGRLDAGPLPRVRAAHKAHPFKTPAPPKRPSAWRASTRCWRDAEPLDKEFSLFTYYPDYLLELNRNGQTTTAYVDVNGQYIDFYYEGEEQLYRSHTTAEEFRQLVHQN